MTGRLLGLAVAAAAALALVVSRSPPARGAPGAGDVQAAYDAASADADARHEAGVRILGVQCEAAKEGRYSCEVGFSKPGAEEGRVFLDAALVEPRGAGWKLLSGLCKRYQ